MFMAQQKTCHSFGSSQDRGKSWKADKNIYAAWSAIVGECRNFDARSTGVEAFDPSIHPPLRLRSGNGASKLIPNRMRHVRHRLLISMGD
jgi:hypothetical protein